MLATEKSSSESEGCSLQQESETNSLRRHRNKRVEEMSLQAAVRTIQNWLFKTKELNLNLSSQLARSHWARHSAFMEAYVTASGNSDTKGLLTQQSLWDIMLTATFSYLGSFTEKLSSPSSSPSWSPPQYTMCCCLLSYSCFTIIYCPRWCITCGHGT